MKYGHNMITVLLKSRFGTLINLFLLIELAIRWSALIAARAKKTEKRKDIMKNKNTNHHKIMDFK